MREAGMYNKQIMLMLKSYLPYGLPNMKEVVFFNITNLAVTNISRNFAHAYCGRVIGPCSQSICLIKIL